MANTVQNLRLAAAEWRAVHEKIHGPLDAQTAETVNEALSFVITCAQVAAGEDGPCCPPKGAPLHSELMADAAEATP